MKKKYQITAFGKPSSVVIPKVDEINVDGVGFINITEPDLSDLEGKEFSISYLVTIGENKIESKENRFYIGNYLVEGNNIINVQVVLELEDSRDNLFSVDFEYNYTPIEDFTTAIIFGENNNYQTEEFYCLKSYVGKDNVISIPPYKNGVEVSALNTYLENLGFYVDELRGDFIKYLLQDNNQYQNKGYYRLGAQPKYKVYLPSYSMNTASGILKENTTIEYVDINFSNCIYMVDSFYRCLKLVEIAPYDVSKCTDFTDTFAGCNSLKRMLLYGMKVSFDISSSTKFEREDLVTILNNLGTVSETQTLTMGSTNLAKLTSEDKAIATNKGWVLA